MAIPKGRDQWDRGWLPGLGSNQGFQLQRLTCYHYTTGHLRADLPKGTELRTFQLSRPP